MLRILQVNEVRGVRGFEKPGIQWTVIALGIALMILLIAATVRIRTLQDLLRRADQVMSTEGKRRETLERDLARERSTRDIPVIIHTSRSLTEQERGRLLPHVLGILSKSGLTRDAAFDLLQRALSGPERRS